MANPNQRVRLNSTASMVTDDPEAVQSIISKFFYYNDTSKEIEATLWEMFRDSISNPELATDSNENCNRACLYRTLSELVCELEKFNGKSCIELPEN